MNQPSTESTSIKGTNLGISGSYPTENKCGTSGPLLSSPGKTSSGKRTTGPKSFVNDIARTLLSGCLSRALRLNAFLKRTAQTSTSGGDGQPEAVFDILNCGPRNRFCTPFVVAHNCLALGYQAGYKKFIFMMRLYGIKPEEIFTEDPTHIQVDEFKNWLTMCEKEEDLAEFHKATPEEIRVMVGAWLQVQDFRLNNPLLRGLWNMMDQGIKTAASHKENFDIRIPSGRVLSYIKPFTRDNQTMAWAVRGDKPEHFYGGKLAQNCSQSLARDYFVAGQCRLLRAGYEILWTVYDEYVIECDTEKDYTAEIAAIVRDTPDWGKACPIDVDINKSHCYTK